MTVSNTIEIPETGSGEVPEWVMIARTGRWMGHPQGPEVITPAHLESALDAFNRDYAANGADLVIDYHHASAVVPMGAERAPAAGWIRQLELRNSGAEIWGRVMWTAEAARAIAAREFRYLSPVVRLGAPDRVSAQPVPMQIHSVALTNTPFMTELQALNSQPTAGSGQRTARSRQG
jgi:phage I-like protein